MKVLFISNTCKLVFVMQQQTNTGRYYLPLLERKTVWGLSLVCKDTPCEYPMNLDESFAGFEVISAVVIRKTVPHLGGFLSNLGW